MKWKNHFIFQNSQFWFFGSLSAGSRSRLKPPSDLYYIDWHSWIQSFFYSFRRISRPFPLALLIFLRRFLNILTEILLSFLWYYTKKFSVVSSLEMVRNEWFTLLTVHFVKIRKRLAWELNFCTQKSANSNSLIWWGLFWQNWWFCQNQFCSKTDIVLDSDVLQKPTIAHWKA